MWDFFETARHRHAVRKYRNSGPVEEEKLHAVLEMACAAPSAGDLQSYRIYAVENPELRQRLRRGSPRPGSAPSTTRRSRTSCSSRKACNLSRCSAWAYPAELPPPTPRRPLGEIVTYIG